MAKIRVIKSKDIPAYKESKKQEKVKGNGKKEERKPLSKIRQEWQDDVKKTSMSKYIADMKVWNGGARL